MVDRLCLTIFAPAHYFQAYSYCIDSKLLNGIHDFSIQLSSFLMFSFIIFLQLCIIVFIGTNTYHIVWSMKKKCHWGASNCEAL